MGEWFENSFGEDYLRVYSHRNEQSADREMKWLQKELDLKAGDRVLDFCCGNGRHARAIAEMGCSVTGFDLSEILLRVAREKDPEQLIHWVQGDARNVPLNDSFDVIVNLFTSFGYFQADADHLQVLREMSRLLKSNGRWVIDFLNAPRVRNDFVHQSEKVVNELHVFEKRWVDQERINKEIRVCTDQGEIRTYLESVRLYELEDMQKLCDSAGLKIEKIYGDFDGQVYQSASSPRLILIGTVMKNDSEK